MRREERERKEREAYERVPDDPAEFAAWDEVPLMARSNEAGFVQYRRLLLPALVSGIVLVIALPFFTGYARRRVAGEERAALADLRAVHAAMAGYKAANGGFYDMRLACLVSPECLPNRAVPPARLADTSLVSTELRHGHRFTFVPGPRPASLPTTSSPTSVISYCYEATRQETPFDTRAAGRSLAIDDTGRICVDSRPIECVRGRLRRDGTTLD